MVYPNTFDRLHIGPSGNPGDLPACPPGVCTTELAIDQCLERGWDTMELAFVQQVFLRREEAERVAVKARQLAFPLSCHGSYYVNLNAAEKQKVGASRSRIVEAATRITQAGGHSVVFHSAFFLGKDSAEVTAKVIEELRKVEDELKAKDVRCWLRPELTGKPLQHGTVEELIKLSNGVETVLPCIDWSHLHARNGGGFNSYEEWCEVLDKLATGIRNKNVLQRMHMHVSGIEYGPRGEKKHIPLALADLRYKELMAALKQAGVCGTLVVEAPRESLDVDIGMFRDAWEAA
ncbi:MAG: TIM barrel protein [bacterium]|nr:TIM barrel protein [bacterium]